MRTILTILFSLILSLETNAQGGTSCNEASSATNTSSGSNSCDHTGGVDQWFAYTASENGKITLSNCGLTNTDTQVEVYANCGATIPFISNDDYCNVQSTLAFEATIGTTYYIKWIYKSGPLNYNWNLTEEMADKGDFCDNPHTASIGINHADHSNGVDQWYSYSPTNDNKVTISSCNQTLENTFVEVYESCSGYPIYFSNNYCSYQSLVTFNASSQKTYYIRWKNTSTSNTYDWTLSEGTAQQGDFCNDPKVASIGTNQCDHTAGTDQWFTYTPTANGELKISSCGQTSANTYLEVYSNCNTLLYTNNDYCNQQSQIAFIASAEKTYYIRWVNLYNPGIYNWTIEESGDTEGYYCETPYTAVEGTNFCDHTVGYDQWFSYTPTADGRATASSCGASENTRLLIYKECGGVEYISKNNTCNLQESATFPVFANNTYYICWKSTYTSGTYNWTLTRDEPADGESCSTAFVATTGDNITNHTSDFDQWYTYTAPKDGTLIISSCNVDDADTWLQIYSDCNTLIDENDNYCSFQSELRYTVQEGETIYIRWLGEKAKDKNYTWNISYDESTYIKTEDASKKNVFFPNPNSGTFYADLSNYKDQQLTIKAYDLSGSMLYANKFEGGKKVSCTIENVPAGTYIISIYTIDNDVLITELLKITK